MKNNFELYIHIPFCIKKCNYCDFTSFPKDESIRKQYVTALINEIRARRAELEGEVCSIFIGGGTPSLLKEGYIKEILSAVKENYRIADDAEISIEANPCTVTEEKIREYREAGINRISIGAQSIFDRQLKLLGRCHDFEQFKKAYDIVKENGFSNINIDLMFALPEQDIDMWKKTLEYIAGLDITHISAYSLIIEEGTPFYEIEKELKLPGEDETADMYEMTQKLLEKHGFHQYEISNYSKHGFECRHNLGYWTGVLYLGFGLGASSYTGANRFTNTYELDEYLEYSAVPEAIKKNCISVEEDSMSEFIILGLRLAKGFSCKEFFTRFGKDVYEVFGTEIEKLLKLSLLERSGDNIRIPKNRLFVSNSIMTEFIR